RGGEIAPEDLWVRGGETPFKPGPVVGELQKAGIPAAIERGKVVIRQDKLMVKAGARIPRDVAQQLARLEIFPLVVGLDLRGAQEQGGDVEWNMCTWRWSCTRPGSRSMRRT